MEIKNKELEKLKVLYKIRLAVGDPKGNLTQDELTQRITDIVFALGTSIVLAERDLAPGPKLIDEWKSLLFDSVV